MSFKVKIPSHRDSAKAGISCDPMWAGGIITSYSRRSWRQVIAFLAITTATFESAQAQHAVALRCNLSSKKVPSPQPYNSMLEGIERVNRVTLDVEQQTILFEALSDDPTKPSKAWPFPGYQPARCSFALRVTDNGKAYPTYLGTQNCGAGQVFWYEPSKRSFTYLVVNVLGISTFEWTCDPGPEMHQPK